MARGLTIPLGTHPVALRLLVVGASRGVGRSLVARALHSGSRVVGAARRVEDVPEGATAVRCDVRDDRSCAAMVDVALSTLGRLDAVAVLAGTTPIGELRDAGPEVWRDVLETNVIGAANVLRPCIDPLLGNDGRALFITSTMVGRPWPGLVPYSASRAALEELLRGARREHPGLRVTTVTLGPTKSGFEENWDPAVAEGAIARWRAEGFLDPDGRSLRPDTVAIALLELIASPLRVDHIDLLPPIRAPQWVDR